LNATKDFWYGNFSEVSVEFSVEDMDNYAPKQRTIAILSCHTVRYLQQLQRNLDSLYTN